MNTSNESGTNETGSVRHDDVLAWVSKELDGELDVRERVLLDDHLAACPRCSQIRSELRGVRGFARDDGERVLPPVGLVDRVVAHVMSPQHAAAGAENLGAQAPILVMRRLRRSAALAAAALLVLGGIYVGRLPREATATEIKGATPPLDPDLKRVLERRESSREDGPLFFELLLPPSTPPRAR